MCVIIVKPAGVKMPAEEVIVAAMTANPDGFGIACPGHHWKGLSRVEFLHRLAKVPVSKPCLLHFRWATHGSVSDANCHPFRSGGVTFMHNGVLTIPTEGDMTDSETAFRRVVMPAVRKFGWRSEGMHLAVRSVIGSSRFAMLKGCDFVLYGQFYREDDGCMYSNLNFRRYLHDARMSLRRGIAL